MPAYFGNKQLFRNRNGSGATREIYFGNKMIMGFTDSEYSTSEIVREKAPAGDYPDVTTNTGVIVIGTNNYNPGYGFSKYYCDHVTVTFIYNGELAFFDCDGNSKIDIYSHISFSYLSAQWTITSRIKINGETKLDENWTGRDTPDNKISFEAYFDTSTRKWTVKYDGRTFTGNAEEWKPSYLRAMCQMWLIPGYQTINTYNGHVSLRNMNRGRGYPSAK